MVWPPSGKAKTKMHAARNTSKPFYSNRKSVSGYSELRKVTQHMRQAMNTHILFVFFATLFIYLIGSSKKFGLEVNREKCVYADISPPQCRAKS
jgi:hypothetical protein